MAKPVFDVAKSKSNSGKAQSMVKSLGLTMVAYAEDDLRSFKMPYPLPRGKEKAWGNSKKCWSTSVAEMLLEQGYLKKGDKDQLRSPLVYSKNYIPMKLNDSTPNGNKYWDKNTALDYQIYCSRSLNRNLTGKFVLLATYDNEDIRDCQMNGTRWVIFYADLTVEIVKRAKIKDYNLEGLKPSVSVNNIEGSIVGKGIVLRKDLPIASGGPGTFGLGGGSTELMGKRDTDPIYKALVE